MSVLRLFILVISVSLGTIGTTRADVILVTDGAGELTGARNVLVDGTLYDVTFREGTFYDVFGDAAGIDAESRYKSNLFSQALLYQVIAGSPFDSSPGSTFGCSNVYLCDMITPYITYGDPAQADAYYMRNHRDWNGYYSYFGTPLFLTFDTAASDTQVWADWSVTNVPAPATVLLFGLGLLALVRQRLERGSY